MEDIEIARNTKLENIVAVAERVGISEEELELYGRYKAKISDEVYKRLQEKNDGKLILVTAINPTPLGEGKTTVAIGLADGLNRLNKNAVLALREPSLGPVFGLKGGATGGGYAQVAPMVDINLHFTGDIHAMTSANNLLSAMIDNHIFSGNSLRIKKVTWKRAVDLNDRTLRKVEVGLSGEKGMLGREDSFDITVASEVMAILCLAEDLNDLKRRLGQIVIGYNGDDKPVFAKDLKAEGAMTVLLRDALKPNLVQSLEHTPSVIHGGPFANIAHGCNSVRATRLALKLGDYVVTEAGFGADLGAEKFIDIKCRKTGIRPSGVVCVATLKSLKYHGGASQKDCGEENIPALEKGIENLLHHVENLRNVFHTNAVVAINQYVTDTKKEIEILQEKLKELDIPLSLTTVWADGGKGAIDLAEKMVEICEDKKELQFAYRLEDDIKTKIEDIAKNVYGASGVQFSEKAENQLGEIEKTGLAKNYPVCIAKTQYSFSDNAKNLLCEEPFEITINDLELKNGAEFVVAKAGKIVTMPGLPKRPAAEKIDIDENGEIVGIF
ncbi:MAG: formate--tetrahydrofolate ligase [Clostridia bacterium]|nr:formate--tetrahydrofolate ligase [Clostridia bacterium]